MLVTQCEGRGAGGLCLPDDCLVLLLLSHASQSCRVPLTAEDELHLHIPRGGPAGEWHAMM